MAEDTPIGTGQGVVWPGRWWRSGCGVVHLPGRMPGSIHGVVVVVGVPEAGQVLQRDIGLVGQEIVMTSAPSYPAAGFKMGLQFLKER